MTATGIPAAYSEDVITIIPCSSNHNDPKFFDKPSYYIQKGQLIRWHNADDINLRIVITTSDAKALSTFVFPWFYHFFFHSSPLYPWMKGNVSVTDNISSLTVTNPKKQMSMYN